MRCVLFTWRWSWNTTTKMRVLRFCLWIWMLLFLYALRLRQVKVQSALYRFLALQPRHRVDVRHDKQKVCVQQRCLLLGKIWCDSWTSRQRGLHVSVSWRLSFENQRQCFSGVLLQNLQPVVQVVSNCAVSDMGANQSRMQTDVASELCVGDPGTDLSANGVPMDNSLFKRIHWRDFARFLTLKP